ASIGGVGCFIQCRHELGRVFERSTTQPQVKGYFSRLETLKADLRIDLFLENEFGCFFGYFFDIHTPFSGVHNDVPATAAVEQYAHVKFLRFALAGRSEEHTSELQ